MPVEALGFCSGEVRGYLGCTGENSRQHQRGDPGSPPFQSSRKVAACGVNALRPLCPTVGGHAHSALCKPAAHLSGGSKAMWPQVEK